MKKRIISLVLIATMLLSLSACGKVDEVSQKVMNDIDSIGEVSLEDAKLIEKTMQTYSSLTDEQKKQVKNYVTLLEAQEEIEKLQAEKGVKMKELVKISVADMYASAVICEEIISYVKKIWDSKIDYVKLVYYDEETYKTYSSIYSSMSYLDRSYIKSARELLPTASEANDSVLADNKSLTEWPEDMNEIKGIYTDLYDAYLKIYELASSPSGNYVSYCSDTSTYIDEFITQYKKIEPYL